MLGECAVILPVAIGDFPQNVGQEVIRFETDGGVIIGERTVILALFAVGRTSIAVSDGELVRRQLTRVDGAGAELNLEFQIVFD